MEDKIIIGMEVHVELDTNTKLFCGCSTKVKEPNSSTCEICVGMPGSKPSLNKKAIEYALRLCLALNCSISKELIFSRKTYFYPDMGKNFQITQYELPLGSNGNLKLDNKEIGITRIHLEEDPASLVHQGNFVLVDYNRSGRPLVEVVTNPELSSAEEAREFMKKLLTTLNYLGIFDQVNGIIKADANISIKGYERIEIKNITGFKEIERALVYEIERQKRLIEEGKKITRETRGWDANKGFTFFQRSKESEDDYGYIFEPDLVPVEIRKEFVDKVKKDIPELAHERIQRYIKQYKLKQEDAEVLAAEYLLAELFEKVSKEINPELAAKWLRRELIRVVNYNKKELYELELDETHIIQLLKLVENKKITNATGQKIMEKLVEKPFDVNEYIKKEGLGVVSGEKELENYCKEAIKENERAVRDYKSGNEKALFFISGSVMKKTRGKADPKIVNEILKRLIK